MRLPVLFHTPFALGLALLLAVAPVGLALEPEAPDADKDEAAAAEVLENPPLRRAIALKRGELQRYMEMQLQELNRVCSLSASQQAHLRLASKGAVEKCVDDWTDEIHENGWINMAGQIDEEIMDQWLASVAGEHVQRELMEHDIWNEAVQGILTESQQAKWKQSQAERAAFRRKGAVEQALVVLDMALLLSPSQCDQVRAIIDEDLGDRFEQLGRSPRSAQEFTRLLSRAKMNEVLTEAQAARWDDLIKQSEFTGYDDWNGDMQFFNGQEIPIMIP